MKNNDQHTIETILKQTYRHFNDRNIDATLAVMHPDVDWPNGVEGELNMDIKPFEITGQDNGHLLIRMLNPFNSIGKRTDGSILLFTRLYMI